MEARVIWEKKIRIGGCLYLVIYGHHANGYFIAIPNWNICIESSEAEDFPYNAGRLEAAGLEAERATRLAAAIAAADIGG